MALAVLAALVVWAMLDHFFQATRSLELGLFSALQDVTYSFGKGTDEFIPLFLRQQSSRYAPTVIRMLESAQPGESEESVALSTATFMTSDVSVAVALKNYGCAHQDSTIVSNIADLLEERNFPPASVSSTESRVETRRLHARVAGALEQERYRLGCNS